MRHRFLLLPLALLLFSGCPGGPELEDDAAGECSDGEDNDEDGALDCADADCTASADCACDDADADGVCDADDACPGEDDGLDADADGVPDGCDVCADGDDGADADADGVPDACDVCADGDDTADADGDGIADACDPCPLDSLDDSDGDGVCDSDDACEGHDDGVDGDGDGTPDGCDACPLDDPDDSDGDGVCDTDDVCPGHPDGVDNNNNGTPDGCDDPSTFPIIPGPFDDYDVGSDGRIATVDGNGGDVLLTCYDASGAAVVTGLNVGTYSQSTTYPEVQISQGNHHVLVVWNEENGDDHDIEYTYLDATCTPVATEQVALTVPSLGEFHHAAIDDSGRAAIAAAWNSTHVAHIDATGTVTSTATMDMGTITTTAAHVALNPTTGDGIVTTQRHSGNGIYYQRFSAGGAWVDAAPVQVSVNYHYWYDGHTVGMNGAGDFVITWRSDGEELELRFFDSTGAVVTQVTRTTPDFEGWDGGHCYDSFRRRNQEIPLRGPNFVLGEVYNWITPAEDRTVMHFEYTPAGVLVGEDSTPHSQQAGLTLRLDRVGGSYAWGPGGIYFLGAYP